MPGEITLHEKKMKAMGEKLALAMLNVVWHLLQMLKLITGICQENTCLLGIKRKLQRLVEIYQLYMMNRVI